MIDPMTGMLIGGGMNLIGSILGQGSANAANSRASGMLQDAWRPINTTTGAATASFDPEGGMTTSLTGDAASFQNQLFSQAMGGNTGQGADVFQQGQGMMNQATNMDINGMATLQAQQLNQMAQPGQDREMGTGIAQMMASGRLGASGGQGMLGQMQQSQDAADLNRQIQSLEQARSMQSQMFGQGMGMMGMGNQMGQQDFRNQMSSGAMATDMFGLENQAGMMSRGMGQDFFGNQQALANIEMQSGSNPFAAFMGGAGSGLMGAGMNAMFPQQRMRGIT